jgi:hypothetical protein
MGGGEIGSGNAGDLVALVIDAFHHQPRPVFSWPISRTGLADRASVDDADRVGRFHRLALMTVVRRPGANCPERHGDAENLSRTAFRLVSMAMTAVVPDSSRPYLPVKQTCLAFASGPFSQNLLQGT